MLIQALCEYADKQLESDIPEGWQEQNIHFRILLTPEGKIADIVDVRTNEVYTDAGGKEKKRILPKTVILPERTQKTCIDSNIIEHRPLYIFGLNYEKDGFTPEDKSQKAKKSHDAFVKANLAFFEDIHSEICDAYRRFLEVWDPEHMSEHPALLKLGKDYKGAYFGFCLEGLRCPLEEDDAFKTAYSERTSDQPEEPAEKTTVICGILGELLTPARIHDKVKFPGGNTTGCVMVGMKEPAFESYGKSQSYNSNISERAMKQYTSAMNRLLSDRNHYKTIGDLVLMYFATKPDDSTECEWFGAQLGFPKPDSLKEQDIMQADQKLDTLGRQMTGGGLTLLPEQGLDEDATFYIVGMTPNSSRICQKFICRDSFGNIVRNLMQHQNDLCIHPDTTGNIYFSQIAKELISPKSTSEKVPPPLISSLIMAALQGTPYPTALLSTIVRRVKTDSDGENDHTTKLNDVRAGIIKACLNRKARSQNRKEEIKMAWDETNQNPAYLCGGLFAVYEKIQKDSAAPVKLNRTIKDSYFASACSCPSVILPRLEKLSQNHVKKLKENTAVFYQKLINALMNGLEGEFPSTLSLEDQGRFIVGYHQMNSRLYTKSPEPNTEPNTEQED